MGGISVVALAVRRLRVTGVCSSDSLGVARYAERLADALAELGMPYELAEAPEPDTPTHFHLANSSRGALWQRRRCARYVVTAHDVVPRARELGPLYTAAVYRGLLPRAAAVVVHSRFAADLLLERARVKRLDVIPHPAPDFASVDPGPARAALGVPSDRLVAVLPGVLKRAKAVAAAVEAFRGRPAWLLVLAGPVEDSRAVAAARAGGAVVLEAPTAERYEQAIVASDVVLCLRRRSVGETNGPLLDALGAGRAVLATRTGSIPEVAGEAARYVEAEANSIRAGLDALADEAERSERAVEATRRASTLTWAASAAAHRELFEETFRG